MLLKNSRGTKKQQRAHRTVVWGSQCRGSRVLRGLRWAVLARGPHAGGDRCQLRPLPPECLAGLHWASRMAHSHGWHPVSTVGWWLCWSWGMRCLLPAWQHRGRWAFYVVADFPPEPQSLEKQAEMTWSFHTWPWKSQNIASTAFSW